MPVPKATMVNGGFQGTDGSDRSTKIRRGSLPGTTRRYSKTYFAAPGMFTRRRTWVDGRKYELEWLLSGFVLNS